MSARAASSALILSLLIAPGLLRPAQAGPWLPAPGEYSTELRGSDFTANTYLNDAGSRIPLGGKWEERSLLSYSELGWKKRVSFILAAPMLSVSSLRAGGSQTSTGLEDLLLGLRYGLRQGRTALATELDWRIPMGYAQPTGPLDRTQDGAQLAPLSLFSDSLHHGGLGQLSLSALGGTALGKRGFMQLGIGFARSYFSFVPGQKRDTTETYYYNQPRESLPDTTIRVDSTYVMPDARQPQTATRWSNDIRTTADVGFWLTPSLLAGGRWIGSFNLSHGFLMPPQNLQLLGPVMVWRVDERLDLTAGSWTTIGGKNALHYDQVYVALTFKQTKLNPLQGFLGGSKPAPLMDGKFALSVTSGAFVPAGDLADAVKTGLNAGVSADYLLAPRFALGADALWIWTTRTVPESARESAWDLGGHGKYFFSKGGTGLRPYAVVGAGAYGPRGGSSGSGDRPYFGLNGGLGVLSELTPELSYGVQAMVHDVLDEGGGTQLYTLGVVVSFARPAVK